MNPGSRLFNIPNRANARSAHVILELLIFWWVLTLDFQCNQGDFEIFFSYYLLFQVQSVLTNSQKAFASGLISRRRANFRVLC